MPSCPRIAQNLRYRVLADQETRLRSTPNTRDTTDGPPKRRTPESPHYMRDCMARDPAAAFRRFQAQGAAIAYGEPEGRTQFRRAIDIQGSDTFRRGVMNDLREIDRTKTGHDLLRALDGSGHRVTIREGLDPETRDLGRGDPQIRSNGLPGTAKDAEINYEPTARPMNVGPRPWERNLPSSVFLEHELVHAEHITHGTVSPGIDQATQVPNEELVTVGLKRNPYDPNFTENAYRAEIGLPKRTSY